MHDHHAAHGSEPVRFAIIGTGYRAGLYLSIAATLPDRLGVTAVVSRDPAQGRQRVGRWNVPVVGSIADLVGPNRPEFVITCVTAAANPEMIGEAVQAGIPVLAETPPAPDLEGLRSLWATVGGSGLVQVAEQYSRQPMNVARLAAVRRGMIGEPTSAQLSMTQLYHAVSLLRGALGVEAEEAEVRAVEFIAPLANPLTRAGWTGDDSPHPATTTIATIDFGGRSALYDFTDGQTRNPLRATRFLIRGTRGELNGESITRLTDPDVVVRTPILRRQTGQQDDFEIADLDQISIDGDVVYRNPYYGARLSDEEISIATIVADMGRWVRGEGEAPYPLAAASYDHAVGLAIQEAARTGRPVHVERRPWSS